MRKRIRLRLAFRRDFFFLSLHNKIILFFSRRARGRETEGLSLIKSINENLRKQCRTPEPFFYSVLEPGAERKGIKSSFLTGLS
jgi:hypothetical protein